MTPTRACSARRARRLVRWYPPAWRARYGEEFCALLECEFEERATSPRRALDVAWGGVVARASGGGLAGPIRDGDRQVRASLAWLSLALCAFLTFGLSVWSQLVVGWQWTSPGTPDTTWAMVVMSLAVAGFVLVGTAATAPLVATVGARILRRHDRRLVVPAVVCMGSVAMLVVGARAFENGWPGTGGHHWAHQGLVPGGLGAFVWALTLGVTSFWAHPGALARFPTSEVAWMAASLVAIVAVGASAATSVRRCELSARLARFELRCGLCVSVLTGVFLTGSCLWLLDRAPRAVLFHVGVIDVVGIVIMALASFVAVRATRRGLAATRLHAATA